MPGIYSPLQRFISFCVIVGRGVVCRVTGRKDEGEYRGFAISKTQKLKGFTEGL